MTYKPNSNDSRLFVKSGDQLDKAAFTIYLVILILSPLLFGAVHTYAYTLMTLGILAGTVLLVIKNVKKDLKSGSYVFQFPKTYVNFGFVILLLFLVFQTIPLPNFIVEILSPESAVVRQNSLPASSIVSGFQDKGWFSLAPYYYPVRMSIIRFTVYGLFFLGLARVLNSRNRIELAVYIILLTCCFESLYGLIQAYSGSAHILWFKKMNHGPDVSGTYINRNHFAGLMEIGLLLAASYTAGLSVRMRKSQKVSGLKKSFKVKLSQLLAGEQRFNKRIWVLFTGVVMGIGLVFSGSRGGMIAAACGMLCMSLFYIFRTDHRRKGFVLLFLFLIISAYAINIGVEYPLSRFKHFDSTFESRTRYARKTMDVYNDYKLAGSGMGSFQYVYPKYQAAVDKERFMRHAHNDWAQFIAEAGIAGMCLLLAGVSFYVFRTIRLWKKRSDPFAVCLGIAPLASMAAIAIHSYSDFNLHIPANFLMLSAVMAIGYSALHLKRRHGESRVLCRYTFVPLRFRGLLFLTILSILILWTGGLATRHFIAEAYCNTVTNSTMNREQNPSLEEIEKAILWDRWNAEYWYKLARELKSTGKESRMDVIRALEQAVHLNPFEVQYHLWLGLEYIYMQQDQDYHRKWLPAADLSMERAAYFTGEKNPYAHVTMGNYWAMRSKTMIGSEPDRIAAWEKACLHYQNAKILEKSKDLKDEIERFIRRYYPDRKTGQENRIMI